MRPLIMIFGVLLLVSCHENASKSNNSIPVTIDYLPEMVGPNVISKSSFEGHASITPDEKELYFAVYSNDHSYSTIAYATKNGKEWAEPQIVSFSGKYSDGSPALSPDGKKLFFSSRRPLPNSTELNSSDLWYVDRIGNNGWSAPRHIDVPGVNTDFYEFSPSVDMQYNLYFCSGRPEGYGDLDVYYVPYEDGAYQDVMLLGDSINTPYHDGNVGVSPDGSMLFTMIQHKPGDFGYDDIHYAVKKGAAWSKMRNIGAIINTYTYDFSPKVSPDGQTLYFSSRINSDFNSPDSTYSYQSFQDRLNSPLNGFGNIYKIQLSELNLQHYE